MTHICVTWLENHWFRLWLVAWMAPSHYLNHCWNIVNWTLRNKLRWNFNRNSNIFIQENAFENVVCEMVAILSRPQCVNSSSDSSYKCIWPCNASNITARADIKQLLDIGGFEIPCQYCHWVQAIVSSWWTMRTFSTLLASIWEIWPVRKLFHTGGQYFRDFPRFFFWGVNLVKQWKQAQY